MSFGPALSRSFLGLLVSLTFFGGVVEAQSSRPKAAAPVKIVGDVLYSGSLWQEKKHEITGLYQVVSNDGALTLHLGSDFKTKKGPDLKLALTTRAIADVTKKNALDGSLVLGLLKSEKGAQHFSIPKGTDLSKYRSLVIHCEKYTVLWGGVPLTQGKVVGYGDKWQKKSKKVRGRFEIVVADGKPIVRVGSEFKTSNAPDLKFVLTNRSPSAAKNENALDGGTIIGLLKSNKGAQEVTGPAAVDPTSFSTLLIHCEQYTKLWGAASIRKP